MIAATSTIILAASEGHGNVQAETFIFGVIAAVLFAALGLVVFSYRNVANRHQRKADQWAKTHGGHSAESDGH